LSEVRSTNFIGKIQDVVDGMNRMPRRVLEVRPGQFLSPFEAENPVNHAAIRSYNEKHRYQKCYTGRKISKRPLPLGCMVFIRMETIPFAKEWRGQASKILYSIASRSNRLPEISYRLQDV